MDPGRKDRLVLLYIEDDPADFQLFSDILIRARLPIALLGAKDVDSAVSLLPPLSHASAPHAILLDLQLPGASGLEFLEALHQNPLAHSIPVLLFTSCADLRQLYHATELGALCIFHKPGTYPDWILAVHKICDWLLTLVPSPMAKPEHPRAHRLAAGPGA